MKFTIKLLSGAAVAAAAVGGASVALAQSAGTPAASGEPERKTNSVLLEEIVVVGIRASLQGAEDLKRNSDTIQDSIVAEDIGKLPDVTAVEALQRITGVQIGRDLGEGGGTVTVGGSAVNSGIEIRGLPQVETTLNGREVFTATGSRVLNFEDVPSALLAGIDVYKDPTANLLEGGIGGTVDLRTRKPFDFKGLELEASGAERYADLARKAKPEFTALASDRWQTGIGEMGALLSFAFQDRSYREDQTTQNAIATSSTAIPGETVNLLNGTYNTEFVGERKRSGVDGVLQWQPANNLQMYAEVSSQELSSKQNQYSFGSTGVVAGSAIVPGSLTTFPGTLDVNQVTFSKAAINSVGAWRSVVDVNRQYALNAKWTPGNLTLTGDVSYTKATEELINPAVVLVATAPTLTQFASLGGVPTTTVGGVDLTNIANYTGGSYAYDTEQHFNGHEGAYKLDAEYSLGSGFFSSLTAGARVANRNLNYQVFTMFGGLKPANIQANPAWFGLTPGDVLFSKTQGSAIEPKFTTFNPDLLHNNLAGVSQTLGLPAVAAAPLQDYNADEKNYSGYFRANFQADLGIPIDGNIGVRVVRVEEFLTGYTGTTAAPTPINFSNGQTNPLPSLNIRFKLRDDLQLRVAASKVVSYPDFTQIRPAISLLPAQQSATGGNPNLKPTKANQVDSSLEWYFAPASSVYADVFYKKVQNFIFQTTTPNAFTINGITYNLTGPATGPAGTIKGAEVGYQQFFDFLPGLWSGLGAQLNYTYVDAAAPTAVAGTTTTLPGLSKNAFNAIGIYEKGPVSFRLAYGWRSQFYTTIYTGATAQLAANPIFTHQFGWLDSSFTYDVTNQWSAYVQGSNLLRTRLTTFYGAGTRPDGNTIDDRQYLVGVRFKF